MSNVFETKKDFTSEVQAIIPESIIVAREKGIDEAVDQLLSLEKKCRVNNDTKNLKEVCLHMVRLCRERGEWMKLNAVLALINKRCTQQKSTMSAVVTETLTYISGTPDQSTKVDLIKALALVCDGKIYIEAESASLAFMLSKIHESNGDLAAATAIIQDVHVETYGSLSKMEKAEYILDQIRLNLLVKDYIRTTIHSRKVNLKTIEEEGFESIKVRFYTMMVELHTIQKDPWEACQAYYKIAETVLKDPADIEADTARRSRSLESCIILLLISRFDNHQSDMMHRIKRNLLTTSLKEVPLDQLYHNTLTLFTTNEIIGFPFVSQKDVFETHPCLHQFNHLNAEIGSHFVSMLKDRVMQHNLRVVAKYYSTVRTARVCELLGLSQDELEQYLSEMSSSGELYIKIDRPAGIVTFSAKRPPEEVLSDWSSDLDSMMHLMEDTFHLINRELVVHKVKKPAAPAAAGVQA